MIGDYITKGELATQNPFVRRYFTGQDGTRAFVISQVLLAKSLKVTAKRDNSTVKVDVPAIQAAIGAKAGVTVSGSDSTEVTYSNAVPLVFGFQIFEVIYARGQWEVRGVAPAAAIAFSDDETTADPGHSPFVADSELMEIGYTGF